MRRDTVSAAAAAAAAAALTVGGVALPFAYGPGVFGFTLYGAILIALSLPLGYGLAGVAVIAMATAATSALTGAPFAQLVSITLLTALLGIVVAAVRALLATTRELLLVRQEMARLAASEERLRLTRDLHDAVKQQVFVAAMQLGTARSLWAKEPTTAAAYLDEADAAIREAQQELSGILSDLRPSALAERALADAVRLLVDDWSRRHGIPVDLHISGDTDVGQQVRAAVFRTVQEALANAARHSDAERVQVRLAGERESVALTVTDDGRGFVSDQAAPGHGLTGMRERVESLGGSITVASQPGLGTRIDCVFPRTGG